MGLFRDEAVKSFSKDSKFVWLNILNRDKTLEYNYDDLNKRIYDYCKFFKEKKIKEGDTVLIILKESLDLYASFFAGIIYGALPAYFAYPSPKQSKELFLKAIENLVKYNEIRIVLTFKDIIDILSQYDYLKNETFIGFFDAKKVQENNIITFNEFPTPDREAFLQFSSGTTGAKKGVKISIEALFNQINAYDSFVKYDSNSKVISWLPHYHDMGLIACMLMPYIKGIPIYMMSPFEWVKNPKMLFDAVTKFKGTHMWLPNFAMGHLTKSIGDDELKDLDLRTVKQIIGCSEPVLYEIEQKFVEKFKNVGISDKVMFNCYAMAENTFAMSSTVQGPLKFLEIDQKEFAQNNRIVLLSGGRRVCSSGIPIPNTKIQIINFKDEPVKEDLVGEVIIKSNCMLDCYHNNPEETSKAFWNDWFRTGDLGFIHEGELYIVGRKKDLIIVGGENIYPQDIELILNEEKNLIPGRNVVFGVEDEKVGTEKIIILAETENIESKFDSTSLRAKIFNTLGISVAEIIILPHMTLKKGTAGKISRFLNKNEYLDGRFDKYLKRKEEKELKTLKDVVLSIVPETVKTDINDSTDLIGSGIIDSFSFINLILALEQKYSIRFPKILLKFENFSNLEEIERTIERIKTEKDSLYNQQNVNPYQAVDGTFGLKKFSFGRFIKLLFSISTWQNIISLLYVNFYNYKIKGFFGVISMRIKAALFGIKIGKGTKCYGIIHFIKGPYSEIKIGKNCVLVSSSPRAGSSSIYAPIKFRTYERSAKIIIEDGVGINGTSITARSKTIFIGKGSMIAPNCVIMDSDFHALWPPEERLTNPGFENDRDVIIEENVWVGNRCIILKGVRIGKNSIINAGSVVDKDIPPNSVVGGVPVVIDKK